MLRGLLYSSSSLRAVFVSSSLLRQRPQTCLFEIQEVRVLLLQRIETALPFFFFFCFEDLALVESFASRFSLCRRATLVSLSHLEKPHRATALFSIEAHTTLPAELCPFLIGRSKAAMQTTPWQSLPLPPRMIGLGDFFDYCQVATFPRVLSSPTAGHKDPIVPPPFFFLMQ